MLKKAKRQAGPYRVGLIGAGTALHAMYGPAFRFLESARLVCVCDPWEEARNRAEDYQGITAYKNLDEMLSAQKLDACIVASPTKFHAGQVIQLAEAGVHAFCEKPMARSVEECDRMINACKAGGVALGVGFMKRYNKAFGIAFDLVKKKRLGRVFSLDCEWNFPAGHDQGTYLHPHSHWRGDAENWGGVFQDHGSHTIDLARIFLGEIVSVSAEMQIVEHGRPVEDVAAVVCRHKKGGVSTHRMNIRTHKPLSEHYELYGTKGTMEIQWGGNWRWSAYTTEPMNVRVYRKGTQVQDFTPRPEQAIDHEISNHWHYLNQLRAFFDAISDGRPVPSGGEDGRKVVEAVNAATLSTATGQTVRLPLEEPVDLENVFARGLLKNR